MNKSEAKKKSWKLVADTIAGFMNASWPFQIPGYKEMNKSDMERITIALLSIVGFCVRKSRGEM